VHPDNRKHVQTVDAHHRQRISVLFVTWAKLSLEFSTPDHIRPRCHKDSIQFTKASHLSALLHKPTSFEDQANGRNPRQCSSVNCIPKNRGAFPNVDDQLLNTASFFVQYPMKRLREVLQTLPALFHVTLDVAAAQGAQDTEAPAQLLRPYRRCYPLHHSAYFSYHTDLAFTACMPHSRSLQAYSACPRCA